MKKYLFILASASPRRKELLTELGIKFKIEKSDYLENNNKTIDPIILATNHAKNKALSISKKYSKVNNVIFGFDTIVVLGREIIGKPFDKNDSIRILSKLSGSTHKVITGFCIIKNSKTKKIIITNHEISLVTFRKISKNEIIKYVNSFNTLDKAGAYAIQSKGSNFIDEIRGDYYNIVGLPVFKFIKELRKNNLY
jgi:septum formation protein